MSLMSELAQALEAVSGCRLLSGDSREALRSLPAESVHMAVTSPPYWGLRSYGTNPVIWGGDSNHEHVWETPTHAKAFNGALCSCGAWLGELGLEPSPDPYIQHLLEVFRELKCVLRRDGLFFLNLGDSCHRGQWAMIPARVALAMQDDGWLLRSEIIWHKPAPMPESVKNRPTKSHEMLYMFAKNSRYFFDMEAIKESCVKCGGARDPRVGQITANPRKDRAIDVPGSPMDRGGTRNSGLALDIGRDTKRHIRDVWTLSSEPLKDEHYAAFPTKLVEPCVLAATSERGVCPSCGAQWVRVLDRKGGYPAGSHRLREDFTESIAGTKEIFADGPLRGGFSRVLRKYGMPEYSTSGWKQTCGCESQIPIPATILDPFSGSGTTAVVCKRLGRDFIGIDLKSEYHDIARRRLAREEIRDKFPTAAGRESGEEILQQTNEAVGCV